MLYPRVRALSARYNTLAGGIAAAALTLLSALLLTPNMSKSPGELMKEAKASGSASHIVVVERVGLSDEKSAFETLRYHR
jgi:hypothetical protein